MMRFRHHHQYVTRGEFDRTVAQLTERISLMATQADLDALSAALDQTSSDLTVSVAAVQAELDALSAANPALDLSGVSAKVTALDDAVKGVASLKPTQPAA